MNFFCPSAIFYTVCTYCMAQLSSFDTGTYQNILVERFAIVLLVFFFYSLHVNFRAAHHDTCEDVFAGSFALQAI